MPYSVIDYVADKTLTAEQNARGRLSHYESEIARLQAIKYALTIETLKPKLEPTDDKGR